MVFKMIGVALKYSNQSVAEEFFQLFKTPWEYYRKERPYCVVISEDSDSVSINSRLNIVIDSNFTENLGDSQNRNKSSILVKAGETVFPVYLGVKKIHGDTPFLVAEETGESVGSRACDSGKTVLRIGLNLFQEVEYLLVHGQPAKFAEYPTLDIHIANLRSWIIEYGSPVVEIPPVPNGHKFFVFLTHDVDFAGIRNHKLDRTLLGFIYRASIGSIIRFFKRRLSFRKMIQNWAAVLSLPLVFWGMTKDFWIQFRRYALIEKGLGSTFFVVPFKETSGAKFSGSAPAIRKVRYDLEDIKDEINKLLEMGFEIGVHGLDAWMDSNKGKAEYAKIKKLIGDIVNSCV